MPTSACKPAPPSTGSSSSRGRRNRYLLQGVDGLYFTALAGSTWIGTTADPAAAHAFVDVDAAAARAQALIANGLAVARIAPVLLP